MLCFEGEWFEDKMTTRSVMTSHLTQRDDASSDAA